MAGRGAEANTWGEKAKIDTLASMLYVQSNWSLGQHHLNERHRKTRWVELFPPVGDHQHTAGLNNGHNGDVRST